VYCRFSGADSTHHIVVLIKLLLILHPVLDCGFILVPVLCYMVKLHSVHVHNSACVKGILSLAEEFRTMSAISGTMTFPSAIRFLPLHCISLLDGLLNPVKPGYRGIIAQSWLILSIVECCSMKDVTQSIKCYSIPGKMVQRIFGTIIVIWEIHSTFQKTPSDVPTTRSSR
jgi:hypothetical protein